MSITSPLLDFELLFPSAIIPDITRRLPVSFKSIPSPNLSPLSNELPRSKSFDPV